VPYIVAIMEPLTVELPYNMLLRLLHVFQGHKPLMETLSFQNCEKFVTLLQYSYLFVCLLDTVSQVTQCLYRIEN
jgi:hypothetical protein